MRWTISFDETVVCIRKDEYTLPCLTSEYLSLMKDVDNSIKQYIISTPF
jgi:hypothetical protein